MPRLVDLSGKRFGRLTVLNRNGSSPAGALWLCKCDCGTETTIRGGSLTAGRSQSCGCYCREVWRAIGHRNKAHGHSNPATPTYVVWRNMLDRCGNPLNHRYSDYGGRGITVCDRWRESFENFLGDMGVRPQGRSIDRTNNDGNYEPSNCRWATATEQIANKRKYTKRTEKEDGHNSVR